MVRPWWRAGAAALAACSVLVACTDDSASLGGQEPWTEDSAPWMQPAGTPLGADLVVPEGARLVGPVFSTIGQRSPIEGREWYVEGQLAHLLADGDIVDVSDDLVEQLGGLDALEIDSNDTICSQETVDKDANYRDTMPYTGDLDADAVEIHCAATLDNGVSEPGGGIAFDLRQDVTEPDLPVQGVVSWPESNVQVPDSLPDAPEGVGGPDTITTDVEGDPDLDIADDSFLAGRQGWGSITGGFTAVIGVTGDPDKVFDAYLGYVDAEATQREAQIGDLRVREGVLGGAGGVTYTVTLNEIAGDAWILLEAYND